MSGYALLAPATFVRVLHRGWSCHGMFRCRNSTCLCFHVVLPEQIWKVETDEENRKVEYLSTLAKHTQAVNVVRWAPKGELLASAGDDGNIILWVPAENHLPSTFGSEGLEDKETWRAKHMCRSSGAEIYDLAWSPDSSHFIVGSMDNIARIYSAATGKMPAQTSHPPASGDRC